MKHKIEKCNGHEGIEEIYKAYLFNDIDFHEYQERAAIIEYDANISPRVAGTLAFNDVIKNNSYLKGKVK